MSKFLRFGEKLAATAATAATFCSNTVAALLSYGSSTGSNTLDTLYSRLFPSKMPINGSSGSSSSSTSPNFAQEKNDLREEVVNSPSDEHFRDSYDLGDDYDEDDYDEWYGDNYEEWWDGPVFNTRGSNYGWEEEAVDEAIDEEKPGEYPPGDVGDIPW